MSERGRDTDIARFIHATDEVLSILKIFKLKSSDKKTL